MGNCMETCTLRQQEEREPREQEGGVAAGGFVTESEFGKGGIRIKIVLTKEELQWFMFQLKNKEGKKLVDVLEEIERGRGKVEAWKPTLESIMEIPEVPEMDR